MNTPQLIHWTEDGAEHNARWRSEAGMPAPRRVVVADDTTSADTAYQLACEGTALLWRGDFQNARQLLQAMARRADKPKKAHRTRPPSRPADTPPAPAEAFHLHRPAQSQRARTLGMLLLPFEAGHVLPLRRAPDVRRVRSEAYGEADAPTSLRCASCRA